MIEFVTCLAEEEYICISLLTFNCLIAPILSNQAVKMC